MPVVAVTDQSQVAAARRAALARAAALGFDEAASGRVGLVATELATNLLRHGGGGELIFEAFDDGDGLGIDLIALDRGRGMADTDRCVVDGYSTGGTMGAGLGAVKRASARFEIWSAPGRGTAVLARLSRGASAPVAGGGCEWGAVSLPIAGEAACGDGWAVNAASAHTSFVVADGLGHGPSAAMAAQGALELFTAHAGMEKPGALLRRMHRGIASTRGAAVGVAEVMDDSPALTFSGVGNIACWLIDAKVKRAVSMNGIVGHAMARTQEFQHEFPRGALLVMASDGLETSWTLDSYAGLRVCHPLLIAAVLYRDAARRRDDVTVLVARRRP